MEEARRILKPGGVLCLVDNNPRSKTIQNLPPALVTLMKSTGEGGAHAFVYVCGGGEEGLEGTCGWASEEVDGRPLMVAGE